MAKATNATVACPKCGRKQPFRTPDALYWCDNCRGQFDGDPDEGGTYCDDPSKRMERAEEDRIRNQNRTRARRNGR